MADTSNSTSIYRVGVSPQTRTVISSRNRVKATFAGESNWNPVVIGTVTQFNVKDGRNTDPVRGIGFGDQIQELVPGVSEPVSISINRTALYTSNIFQVFGYNSGVNGLVRALKHHKWPFDIVQEMIMSEVPEVKGALIALDTRGVTPATADGLPVSDDPLINGMTAIATLYCGCWMTSYSKSMQADQAIISEDCEVSCTDIFAGEGILVLAADNTTDALIGNPKSKILFPS